MLQQPIEGPEPYQPQLDSRQAGRYLGDVGPKLFEALMAEHLPTVRPIWIGRYKYWAWMDVAVLRYVLTRADTSPPPDKDVRAAEE